LSSVGSDGHRPRRARSIPFWGAAVSLLGCLDEPPTFAPRGQIPPFIIAGQVDPPLGAIYEGPSSFPISVPFRSEDVNFPLEARLYLDLVPGTATLNPADNAIVPPGNFEEPRLVSLDWNRSVGAGCHSLTLIMTYGENFDPLTGLPIDDSRAARIVWWLNINDVDADTRMASCPGASQVDAVPGPP
jgi:hypothetical protein